MPVCPPVSFGPGGFLYHKEIIMSSKIFKTYRQLLRILRSRGMTIKSGSATTRAISELEKENYYNVINGYKDLFLSSPATTTTDEIYKSGVTFDEIYALYNFDREIRIIYLKYLLKIENNFKTVVSHSFSEKYGHDNYLKLENFQSNTSTDLSVLQRIARNRHLDIVKDRKTIEQISAEENIANVTKLFGDIQQEIARQLGKHHEVVTHYMTQHGYIPLWVLVNVLTFGKVTTFYYNLKEQDKIDIARQFKLSYKELHKYMSMAGFARNKCAHDERFYNIRFAQRLHTKSIPTFSILKLPRDKSGSYTQGICDIYAMAIIFNRLLTHTELKEFVSSMDSCIKKLNRQLITISINDILKVMGYPPNWKDILKL